MIQHLAIIMDGNGRWAEQRGLTRSDGHRAGAKAIGVAARAAIKAGKLYVPPAGLDCHNCSICNLEDK